MKFIKKEKVYIVYQDPVLVRHVYKTLVVKYDSEMKTTVAVFKTTIHMFYIVPVKELIVLPSVITKG